MLRRMRRHKPRTGLGFRCCGDNDLEAVSELLEDDDGARKQAALAVDLRTDVLADRGPPDVAGSHKRWRLSA